MPPDADKNRQLQNRFTKEFVDPTTPSHTSDTENDDPATQKRLTSIKSLGETEIAIDGVIYDIKDFAEHHPGGASILLFGGNDVTVQYKMIHPYHTGKHLEKMTKVGVVENYKSEYVFDTPFEREIKREVYKIVRRGREFGTTGFFVRAFIYISLMAFLQFLWATRGASWTLAFALGVSQALIGLNVQHDANHGAASRKSWVNDLLGFGADFIGGCKWLWMEQHWTHHSYTNHAEKDPDSFSAEPMMNFNDYELGDKRRKWYHKYQGLYFLPMLSFYWLSAVFNPQILDLRQRGAVSIGMVFDNSFVVSRRKYAIAMRLLYIYLNVVRPIQINGLTITTIGQILFMGACESLTLAVLFSLSHNFENADRDPTKIYRNSGEPVDWFKSQVETSSTYGGFIAGALTGGLNFQVEHHLFPRMCSAWYPYIAPTVREICKKHEVRYVYYPYVWQNFISTVRYMHNAGTGANWEDLAQPLSGKN